MLLADGRRVGLVRIRYFRQNQSPALCVTAWTALRAQGKPIDADALAHAVEQAWYAELAAHLKRFHDGGIAAVLVDVGQNNGGNDSGDIAARLFSSRPVHSPRLLVSQSTDGSAYLDEQIGDMRQALATKPSAATASALRANIKAFEQSKKDVAKPCPMDWVWQTRRDWTTNTCKRLVPAGTAGGPSSYLPPASDKDNAGARALHWPLARQQHWGAWNGPVYLLTDARTYSAAEMFAAVMRDNHIARTVGDTTGRAGCGFMVDAVPVVLAHSRLRFRIPNCVRLRGDGSDEVAGIAPDLPAVPMEGEDRRAWAMRVLSAVGSDVQTQDADQQKDR
jgi:C-terminal processing protease CtpA/Prc